MKIDLLYKGIIGILKDMKKLISWYNILITNGLSDFATEEEGEEEDAAEK